MNSITQAVDLLKQGRLVAFPTETVYGLGADATNPAAIARIYKTKGRPSTNPLIIHVASIEIAKQYVIHWPPIADLLADKFWPGPLTLILPKNNLIPGTATAGLPNVAIRVPNHPLALDLLRAFAGPLAAPSANRSTHVSPTSAQHVLDEFPYSAAANEVAESDPALILDGGDCAVGIESTVLDLTTTPPTILRPGQIGPADLEPLIGKVQIRSQIVNASVSARSPGQQETHYAPLTPTFHFETAQRGLITPDKHGLIALSPIHVFKKWGKIIAMPNDPADYARHLYAVLRELDEMGLEAIFAEMPPEEAKWAAVRDRLIRASRPFANP